MFEKVTCRRAERRTVLQLRGISAAVAAHGLCVLGIAAFSLAAPAAEPPVEEATYLLLQSPETFTELQRPTPGPYARVAIPSRAASPAPVEREQAPERVLEPNRDVERLALRMDARALPEPTLDLDQIPASGPAMDDAWMRGLGDLGPGDVSGGASGGSADGVAADALPLVDSDVFATPPQMLNRRLVSRLLSEDYPSRLMWAGVEGEVVVAFIIGVDGRAEMNNVEVLSATHDGFIPAALQGLRRMRFRPAELDGRQVRVRVSIPFVWQLPKRS